MYRSVSLAITLLLIWTGARAAAETQLSPVLIQDKAVLLVSGLGYEGRGVGGNALDVYESVHIIRPLFRLQANASADVFAVQSNLVSPASIRSAMMEFGTGRSIGGPFSCALRGQFERYALSDTDLISLLPTVSFGTRHFFVTGGVNFRTFKYDASAVTPGSSWNHLEYQFTFAIGARFFPTRGLGLRFAMQNYDDYATGSFSSIGYEASAMLRLRSIFLSGQIVWRPSGMIALASVPSQAACRLFVGCPL